MKCPKCQAENPDDTLFCGKCGTKFEAEEEVSASPTKTLETPTEELTTGSTFASRYQIIEELGKGGMGKVYRVLDKELKEEVALKLIKPEIASDKKTLERFSNELKLARKIGHKNVGRMYELMEEKGTRYITMEYVPGEDLKRLIRKIGQLSTGQAIPIVKQICEGLVEAHRLGVVHRDLKPQNIMVDEEGNARILDFGIARAIKGKGITGAGVMVGTPEYMSPEQAEVKEVDQRSDIYSLGVILYEMVTGRVPFEGETPLGIAMKHKSEMPQDPREINTQIPDDLSKVILRCMEKDKEKRYQSAGEVRSEFENIEKGIPTTEKVIPKRKPITSKEITVTFGLKKLFIPALVVIAIVIAVVIILKLIPKKEVIPIAQSDKPSVAVLPFTDLSPQKDQDYFCEGLADSIINALTQVRGLKVPARGSSFSFKGRNQDYGEIGKTLEVKTILDGSLQKSGDSLRITTQLVSVEDGSLLWSRQFNKKMEDVFFIQDEITSAIVANLKLTLLGEEKEIILKRYTKNPEAYQNYIRGRFFLGKRTEEGLMKAIQCFEEAIADDPNYAMAYAGMANAYFVLPDYSGIIPAKEAYLKAKESALRALEIDNSVAEAHSALANVKWRNWDFEGAERDFKKAIELSPGLASVHYFYAYYLTRMGRRDESIKEIKHAHELDPLLLIISRNVGMVFFYARQYDQAIEALQKTLELDPNFKRTHYFLGRTYVQKSMYEEALIEFQKEKNIFKKWDPTLEYNIGIAYAKMGKKEEAEQVLDELIKKSKAYYGIALINFALGENNQGFKWLDKAYEERYGILVSLRVEPGFDSVRSDPRFKALLKKVGLD